MRVYIMHSTVMVSQMVFMGEAIESPIEMDSDIFKGETSCLFVHISQWFAV